MAASGESDEAAAWRRHDAWSDPGPHAAALAALPADLPRILETVQGLLVHVGWTHLYGLDRSVFAAEARETLPLADRLSAIRARDDRPLLYPRPPGMRAPGTCRDFALATCGLLRTHGVPARVRCGFAAYFRGRPFEDHWICEALGADGRWLRADAQLDPAMRRALDIDFDPARLPDGAFVTAAEAWRQVRDGADPGDFGHGDEAAGVWFLRVNLARDRLALSGRLASAWDTWRAAPEAVRAASAHAEACDALATPGGIGPGPPFWNT